MKITLTIAELTEIVRSRYSLPDDVSLEIAGYSGINHLDADKLISRLQAEDCFDGNFNPRPEKKIACIKMVRDVYANTVRPGSLVCGLANAKYAVEEWPVFIQYVKKHGFPAMDGSVEPKWRGAL